MGQITPVMTSVHPQAQSCHKGPSEGIFPGWIRAVTYGVAAEGAF